MGKFPFKYQENSIKALASEAIVPMRAEANERSEMVSQVLYGEPLEIIEAKEKWILVRSMVDDYQGWVSQNMIKRHTEQEFEQLVSTPFSVLPVDSYALIDANIYPMLLPAGSFLYNVNEYKHISKNKDEFVRIIPSIKKSPEGGHTVTSSALQFMNSPYLWGGKTTYGIDCSGLVQIVFRTHGFYLPRDASQQVQQGEVVNFIDGARPGDLAFFDNEDGAIIHVGIISENRKIIHASGRVREDSIDHQGIYNLDKKEYTHKLRVIKRILLL